MTSLRLKRGTTTQHTTYTGPPGELTMDTTGTHLRLHDGTTAGGVAVGSMTVTSIKTNSYNANVNELVRIDSTAGGFTITLPASPSDGAKISFLDVANKCGTNPVLVSANGKTILGDSTGINLDMNGAGLSLIFNNLTNDWSKIDMFSSSFAVVDLAQQITYVDDVFSAYTYTGNGSSQTINNGIDLAGKGGMVWIKSRNAPTNHRVYDTVRGRTYGIGTNGTAGQSNDDPHCLSAFNNNGYTIGDTGPGDLNANNYTYVSWTFRKAPKFFDVVTYTGNGSTTSGAYRIAHSLGIAPGFIIIKPTSASGPWVCFARINSTTYAIPVSQGTSTFGLAYTNAAYAFSDATSYFSSTSIDPQALSYAADVNVNGVTYVAYLFAHDTGADGLIQCGSFTTDGSGNATVPLGWEPQFILWKPSSSAGDWQILDSSRDLSITSQLALKANLSNAEAAYAASTVKVNATGFTFIWAALASTTCVYMAIRRPNKPPTVGTQVFMPVAYNGASATNYLVQSGITVDWFLTSIRPAIADRFNSATRLTGNRFMKTILTDGETEGPTYYPSNPFASNSGVFVNNSLNYGDFISYNFKRAPGVFDVVCYTGTGVSTTVAHNLIAAPELIITKQRSIAGTSWITLATTLSGFLYLDTTAGIDTANAKYYFGNNTSYIAPTASSFSVATDNYTNGTSRLYVAYLFATKAGISKVGSYTGNGSSQTVNCGFSTGARFILIKRTDSTGDWYVWDTTRGIVAGNDPHLSLNTTAAEVTGDDSIDPNNTGFIINQVAATNINVNNGTYIFLAFA
jgi:hypothetical protein